MYKQTKRQKRHSVKRLDAMAADNDNDNLWLIPCTYHILICRSF
uniref:Uncharacterized protein n=1 Tax=Anguilla anguilla TaxID=7936 RepID=A0A0E9UG92_ANGAN